MNKIILLKSIDRVIGSTVAKILPVPSRQHSSAANKILVIRPGGIGDAVLLAPTIQALKKQYPKSSITVLAEKRNAGVFALIPGISQVLRYDVPKEFLTAFRLKPGIAIDTEQYHRLSVVVARLIGAAVLIGFGTNERARLFHHPIPYSQDDYELDSFFKLLSPLGIVPLSKPEGPFLTIPETARSKADVLLNSLGGKPFVTLFPGASIAERRWGADKFHEVASRHSSEGMGVVVVGGKEDYCEGETIINKVGGLNLAGKTTLAETAAIIERSSLLISGDSGVLHIAVGLDTPTVSLFGPGIAKKWAPRGEKHIVLNKNLPCSPCTQFGYTPKCPRNAECMKLLSVDEVLSSALKLLQNS